MFTPAGHVDRPALLSLRSDRMTTKRGFLERRGTAALMLGLFVAGGLIFIFAGTLARATRSEAEAASARAGVAVLEAQLEARQVELEFVETESFVEQFARSVSYGAEGEIAFGLPEDAPSPPPIEPIGSSDSAQRDPPPLKAWIDLLFG